MGIISLLFRLVILISYQYSCIKIAGENDDGYSYLKNYHVNFERCQKVRYYSDEAAQDETLDSPLITKQFVVFRICDSSEINSGSSSGSASGTYQWCGNCNANYGEYVMEASDYLQVTAEFATQMLEQTCNECGSYMNQCPSECQYINNNVDYLDAADYIYCTQVGETNDGTAVYAGPRCSSDGSTVRIGAFSDENCWHQMKNFNLKNLLGSTIRHHSFQYATSRSCFSCYSGDGENEVCENLYSQAGKCELKHGFKSGLMADYASDDKIYENQLANEYDVCTFIESFFGGFDNDEGDIIVRKRQDLYLREVTTNQRLALTVLSLTLISLSVYIMYLHSYIKVHLGWLTFYTCQSDSTLV